jgi:hypothetical protein
MKGFNPLPPYDQDMRKERGCPLDDGLFFINWPLIASRFLSHRQRAQFENLEVKILKTD